MIRKLAVMAVTACLVSLVGVAPASASCGEIVGAGVEPGARVTACVNSNEVAAQPHAGPFIGVGISSPAGFTPVGVLPGQPNGPIVGSSSVCVNSWCALGAKVDAGTSRVNAGPLTFHLPVCASTIDGNPC